MKEPKTYVIDNSVMLKPLLLEEGADKVKRIFTLKDNYRLAILLPDLFRYEFFNKVMRTFNEELANKAWNEITELQVSIIPLEADLIDVASRLMAKYPRISFYDAAYHALAKAYRVPLVTADEKYYTMTRKEGDVKLLEKLKV